jgi:hypothetical protein
LDIRSGGLLQVSDGGTLRAEGDFKLTKRIPGTPDTLEDFVTSDAANKRLTVASDGELRVEGTLRLPSGATAEFVGGAGVNMNATFNLEQSDITYLQWRPWEQTLAVLTGGRILVENGGTLNVAGTLISTGSVDFTARVKDAFEKSVRRGNIVVNTSGGTVYTYGTGDPAVSFTRVVVAGVPMVAFGQDPLTEVPYVYLTLNDGRANIKQVAAINVNANTFDLVVDDWDPPTTDVSVNWLAIT